MEPLNSYSKFWSTHHIHTLQHTARKMLLILTLHSWTFCIYKYMHNWPLQSFSQDYVLASHIILVMCINFMCWWWNLQFKVDSKDRLLRNFFMEIFFYFFIRVFARNFSEEIFSYFHFIFCLLSFRVFESFLSVISIFLKL